MVYRKSGTMVCPQLRDSLPLGATTRVTDGTVFRSLGIRMDSFSINEAIKMVRKMVCGRDGTTVGNFYVDRTTQAANGLVFQNLDTKMDNSTTDRSTP